eukprot:8091597-Lingulodinium_polyedra.AAC.1
MRERRFRDPDGSRGSRAAVAGWQALAFGTSRGQLRWPLFCCLAVALWEMRAPAARAAACAVV